MSEERFDRLERHMKQLIQMVAENNKTCKEIVIRMDRMDTHMGELTTEFADEKRLNEVRHVELIKEARSQHVDIEYLRNQVSKHDMEINKLKVANQ